jgi:hypothetical protein
VARAGGAVSIANPAVVSRLNATHRTHATRYCKVWTRQQYRAPIAPFGDHVLWTVYLEQTFGYDNASQVTWVGPVRVWTDTTANGFRWHADGAPWGNDWWVPAWLRPQHHSERDPQHRQHPLGRPRVELEAVERGLVNQRRPQRSRRLP